MKTSYILLLTVVLLAFGTMTAYDFGLKAEYDKGTYKNPFKGLTKLNYKDFDIIEINTANMMGVEISQGNTFDVGVREDAAKSVKIKQEGTHLIISLESNKDNGFGEGVLKIKCPKLKELKLDAVLIMNGKQVVHHDYSYTTVFVRNFKQDDLKITMNNATYAKLFDNEFKHLTADVGINQKSPADLVIDKSNHISSADLNILNNGKMTLSDLIVNNNFKCKISDSARVTLTGASLKLIRQE